jgi:Homeodomain-like domain/HNH endonuclease
VFVAGPRYSEEQARAAIAASMSWSESLRRLGMCPTGGAWRVLKKYAVIWGIPTDHFRPNGRPRRQKQSLESLLVRGSKIRSSKLKPRLYAAGLKQPECELCGQGELWHGQRMSLILDHVNGDRDDNRLENLRIVCPNCNATLETRCGRNSRIVREQRACADCGELFPPASDTQSYCSRKCAAQRERSPAERARTRLVERPPVEELVAAVTTVGYEAVGRRFGVSGTSIRKWIAGDGVEPPAGGGRRPPITRSLDDVRAMRAVRLLADGLRDAEVAKQLGVSADTIRDLRRGRTYRHIPRSGGSGVQRAAA